MPSAPFTRRASAQAAVPVAPSSGVQSSPTVVVIWIDWYAYHLSRFRALLECESLADRVIGLELVAGVGVHAGLKFREPIPSSYPVTTLFPHASWQEAKGWKAALAIWRCLNLLKPSVVFVPGYYTLAGLAAACWGKWHGRCTVLMTESTEQDHTRIRWKEAIKSRLICSLFEWAIAGGAPHRRYLQSLNFPENRIARYYDVVDNDYFEERATALRKRFTPAEFGLPDNYFLYVGRIAAEKNVEGLLREYLEYRRKGGSWPLLVVGDGPLASRLKEIAAASGFGASIRFEGIKNSSELPQYYAFASCFILPSTREPWGLVANEAMASGLPVIVSERCGCAEDLVSNGHNGFLFDPDHQHDLARCLQAFEGMPSSQRAEFARASRQIISRFTVAQWASEVARIAESVNL